MTDRRALLRALLRRDLPSFTAKCFATLEPGRPFHAIWHIRHIGWQLSRVAGGEVRRLAITIPPRPLKSICVTVAYTAWAMGHDPGLKVIAVSYADELARLHAAAFRTVVESEWHRALFSAFAISKARQNEVSTTAQGFRYAGSVGGSILGRGADLIVVDDPIKAQAALSVAERRRVKEFYDTTLYTRLNDKGRGAIVIVMQRLHQDDLVGHVLGQKDWELAAIPAIARGPGVPPGARAGLGASASGRRGDRPGPRGRHGARAGTAHAGQHGLRGAVPAGSGAAGRQRDPPRVAALLRRSAARPRPGGGQLGHRLHPRRGERLVGRHRLGAEGRRHLPARRGPRALRGAGAAPAHHRDQPVARRPRHAGRGDRHRPGVVQEMRLHGPVRPILWRPLFDKEARLLAQAPKFEAGQVLLPREAPWLAGYVSELLAFPNGAHDDQVDSTSQALNWLSRRIAIGTPPMRPNPGRPPGAIRRPHGSIARE